MKKIIIASLFLLPAIASADFDTNLRYGAKGEAVYEVQEFLIDQGCLTGSPTGNFFSLTLRAVKCFQSKNGLPVSGYWGPMTREKAAEIIYDDLGEAEAQEKKELGGTPILYDPSKPYVNPNKDIYLPLPASNVYVPQTPSTEQVSHTERERRLSELTQIYLTNKNELEAKIIALKEQYYRDMEMAKNRVAPQFAIDGERERLTREADLKIADIQVQIAKLVNEYERNYLIIKHQ